MKILDGYMFQMKILLRFRCEFQMVVHVKSFSWRFQFQYRASDQGFNKSFRWSSRWCFQHRFWMKGFQAKGSSKHSKMKGSVDCCKESKGEGFTNWRGLRDIRKVSSLRIGTLCLMRQTSKSLMAWIPTKSSSTWDELGILQPTALRTQTSLKTIQLFILTAFFLSVMAVYGCDKEKCLYLPCSSMNWWTMFGCSVLVGPSVLLLQHAKELDNSEERRTWDLSKHVDVAAARYDENKFGYVRSHHWGTLRAHFFLNWLVSLILKSIFELERHKRMLRLHMGCLWVRPHHWKTMQHCIWRQLIITSCSSQGVHWAWQVCLHQQKQPCKDDGRAEHGHYRWNSSCNKQCLAMLSNA